LVALKAQPCAARLDKIKDLKKKLMAQSAANLGF